MAGVTLRRIMPLSMCFSENAMSSSTSHATRSRFKPIARHDLVSCQQCSRNIIPRVVTYRGQPYQSICPFCGETVSRFPSGLQKLLQPFLTRVLSWQVLKWLTVMSLCFGILGSVVSWLKLSDAVSVYSAIGMIVCALMALAELFVQAVEHLAAKLSHESNYYWAALVLMLMVLIHFQPEWMGYVPMLAGILLLRWFLVGIVRSVWVNQY
ncbi:MAG: hypothetical protein ABL925_20550 [Methylococcales bacterium]